MFTLGYDYYFGRLDIADTDEERGKTRILHFQYMISTTD